MSEHCKYCGQECEELISKEFSKKLRDSLVKLAESFTILLPYRVSASNNK